MQEPKVWFIINLENVGVVFMGYLLGHCGIELFVAFEVLQW